MISCILLNLPRMLFCKVKNFSKPKECFCFQFPQKMVWNLKYWISFVQVIDLFSIYMRPACLFANICHQSFVTKIRESYVLFSTIGKPNWWNYSPPQKPCYSNMLPCLKTVDRSMRNKVLSDLDVQMCERFWQCLKSLANPFTCIFYLALTIHQFGSNRGLLKHTCVVLDKSF